MQNGAKFCSFALCVLFVSGSCFSQESSKSGEAQEKARVFITDSQSWEIAGYSGGGAGGGGSTTHGGARPQTAEIIKTFGQRCSEVMVNNIQEKTDYIVLLDHEGGKGMLRHKNKVAVFARITGDSVVSKSTLSLGGSVQEACDAINRDWAANGTKLRAAATAATAPKTSAPPATITVATPAAPTTGKLSIVSIPDGADIEVDGNFVGNAPSDVQVSDGDHTVTIKKTGFKDWERKMKISAGSSIHLSAELEKAVAQ